MVISLKNKLNEQENILTIMKEEYVYTENSLKAIIKEKDEQLDSVRKELEYLKSERNDNFHQMQYLMKDNKFAMFNVRGNKKPIHSHQNSITSMASVSTHYDDRYVDKINSEKLVLEKQLVECKLNYAETAAKFGELEDEFEKVKRRCEVVYYFMLDLC